MALRVWGLPTPGLRGQALLGPSGLTSPGPRCTHACVAARLRGCVRVYVCARVLLGSPLGSGFPALGSGERPSVEAGAEREVVDPPARRPRTGAV